MSFATFVAMSKNNSNSENRNPSCPAEVRRRRACPAMVLTTADTVTALSRRSLAKADLISPTVFTLSTAKSLGLLEHLKNTGAIQSGDFSVCSTRVPRIARRQVAACGRPARNRLPTAIIGFSETNHHQLCLQSAADLQSAGSAFRNSRPSRLHAATRF